jgi:hypothetical protein
MVTEYVSSEERNLSRFSSTNDYKHMTCCEEQCLRFSGITHKKMPHCAIKKPILSKITESVNVRIRNLNMPLSFPAVKELSVKHLFFRN